VAGGSGNSNSYSNCGGGGRGGVKVGMFNEFVHVATWPLVSFVFKQIN